jgi:hypothetical protein
MALFKLVLGGGALLTTRPGSRPAKGPFGRGQDRAGRLMAVPLLLVGAVGLILWAAGSLRG